MNHSVSLLPLLEMFIRDLLEIKFFDFQIIFFLDEYSSEFDDFKKINFLLLCSILINIILNVPFSCYVIHNCIIHSHNFDT